MLTSQSTWGRRNEISRWLKSAIFAIIQALLRIKTFRIGVDNPQPAHPDSKKLDLNELSAIACLLNKTVVNFTFKCLAKLNEYAINYPMKKTTLSPLLLTACLSMVILPASAEVYKCTDEDGIVTITDNPNTQAHPKLCKGMGLGPSNIISGPSPIDGTRSINGKSAKNKKPRNTSTASNSSAASLPTPKTGPNDFPSVDSGTQQNRDASRKQILQDELNSEQVLLSQAQKKLDAEAKIRTPEEQNNIQKYNERVGKFKVQVTAHQKNIAALSKELSRIK